jgi:hypothetical protein
MTDKVSIIIFPVCNRLTSNKTFNVMLYGGKSKKKEYLTKRSTGIGDYKIHCAIRLSVLMSLCN